MTNEELVAEIQQGHNVKENMQQLYDQNYEMIHGICFRFSTKDGCELDDCLQECFFPLRQAAYSFKGCDTFAFYARRAIKNHLCGYVNMLKHGSVRKPKWMTEYRAFINAFELNNGKHPTDQQIAEGTGINISWVQELKKIENNMRPTVDIDGNTIGEEGLKYRDIIPDNDDAMEKCIDEDVAAELWEQCSELGERQCSILKKRVLEEKTLVEISAEYGISPERVGQIVQQSMKKLYANKKVREVASYFDYDCHAAFHGSISKFRQNGTSSTEALALKALEKVHEKERELLKDLDQRSIYVVVSHYHDKRSISQLADELRCNRSTIIKINRLSLEKHPELRQFFKS